MTRKEFQRRLDIELDCLGASDTSFLMDALLAMATQLRRQFCDRSGKLRTPEGIAGLVGETYHVIPRQYSETE